MINMACVKQFAEATGITDIKKAIIIYTKVASIKN
jgi:hypothetical protein